MTRSRNRATQVDKHYYRVLPALKLLSVNILHNSATGLTFANAKIAESSISCFQGHASTPSAALHQVSSNHRCHYIREHRTLRPHCPRTRVHFARSTTTSLTSKFLSVHTNVLLAYTIKRVHTFEKLFLPTEISIFGTIFVSC